MTLVLHEVRHTPLLWLLVFVPLVLVGEHVWSDRHTLLFILSFEKLFFFHSPVYPGQGRFSCDQVKPPATKCNDLKQTPQ